jgi:hypothetical protein
MRACACVATFILILVVSRSTAAAYAFTSFVDTNTSAPGQAANFSGFHNGPPVLDGTDFAFMGEYSGRTGWYKYVGEVLSKVADHTTVIPGDPLGLTFSIGSARDISFSEGEVAFASGRVSGGLFRGIYTDAGGALHAVADATTTMPGSAQTFQILLHPSIDNGVVSFAGRSSSTQRGVYTNLGGSLRAVDANSVSQNHGLTSLDNGNIIYNFPQNSGIKAEIGGVNTTISATGLNPVISGTNFAYLGNTTQSVMANFGSGLTTIANTSTNIPDGTGMFTSFGDLSISGNYVSFLGRGAGPNDMGIYSTLGGMLHKVVAVGDMINGKTVNQLFVSREALSENRLAFVALHSGFGQSLYIATYEPAVEADFNHDGSVDAADYVLWRKTDPSLYGHGVWRTSFSEMPAGASAVATPEPSTVSLTLITLLLALLRRRS